MLRLLKDAVAFKELVAQVLTFDYLGALMASVAFPLFLLPRLGLLSTCLLFGLLNAAVAFASIHLFRERLGPPGALLVKAALVTALLLAGFAGADRLTTLAEEQLYADPVVLTRTTPYQRIVLTQNRAGFQLFLNG